MAKSYWVYILASALCGTLYIGVTNDLTVIAGAGFHRNVNDYWVVRLRGR
jgi:predicted GIY-YIG superfamily endonuclease